MKIAEFVAVLVAACVVFAGCAGGPAVSQPAVSQPATTPAASGLDELDIAVRDASDYLNGNIPAESMIVILNVQSNSETLSDYIIDELIANAVNDKIFDVVDRNQLDLIRAEQNFQLSGEVDDNLALDIGKFLGAQTIVSGRVSQVGDQYRMVIRALEVQTARVQGQYNRNIAASPTIAALMRNSGTPSSGTASGSAPASVPASGSLPSPAPESPAPTASTSAGGSTSSGTGSGAASSTLPDTLTSLTAQLDWLQANAIRGGDYTVRVRANESIGPRTLSYVGRSVTVRLQGVGAMRTISLSSNGSLFTVNSGVTLILDGNITLQGRNNSAPLVAVNTGGTLIMDANSQITGNSNSSNGGGVYVNAGTFTMQGSSVVSGNRASSGGGVCVSYGIFNMLGNAEVSGNTANSHGGVYVYNGTFTMRDSAAVLVNAASSTCGGVGVDGGTFTMRDRSSVSGNTANRNGGGVYVGSGTFTMQNGTVSGNSAFPGGNGGGVHVGENGNFTKTGGTIYGSDEASNDRNSAGNNQGHAVYVHHSRNPRWRNATAGSTMNSNSYGFLEN